MRKVAPILLALLAGVLFPILIWVGLLAALRQPILKGVRRAAYSLLALLTGVFFPLLIWIGLGVAVYQRLCERISQREPARTLGEILAAAGLEIQWEFSEGRSPAVPVFTKRRMSEIRELLTRAGL